MEGFEATKVQMAELNRERMLDGVRADGSIMPNYSYISRVVYGYPDEPIKLKKTGAFQAAIEVKIEGGTINTDSTDEKSEKLKRRYGEEIFGLGGDYKREYNKKHLRPAIVQAVKKRLGLKKAN